MNEAGKWAGMQSTMSVAGSVRWFDDPYSYDQAAQAGIAVIAVIENLRIAGPIRPQQPYSKEVLAVMGRIGRTAAETVLHGSERRLQRKDHAGKQRGE